MISTRLTTSPNLGTGRRTRSCWPTRPDVYACPSDPRPRAHGTARQAMLPWWDRTRRGRARSRGSSSDFGKDARRHDHARRGDQLGHRLGGTEGLVAGRSLVRPRQVARARCRATMAGARSSSSPTTTAPASTWRWPMAACVCLRTDGRSTEDLRKVLQIGGCKDRADRH